MTDWTSLVGFDPSVLNERQLVLVETSPSTIEGLELTQATALAGALSQRRSQLAMIAQQVQKSGAKQSKKAVKYRAGTGLSRCANCAHFEQERENGCAIVSGVIDPRDICNAWKDAE